MKKSLLVFLTISLFFGGYQTYAADCTTVVPGSLYVCDSTHTYCNNPGGTCSCQAGSITNGQTCTYGDGNKTIIDLSLGGETCNDIDGCTCTNTSVSGFPTFDVALASTSCTWNAIVYPTITLGNLTTSSNTANYQITVNKAGTLTYAGSCGNGSLSSATVGSNNGTFSSLPNGTYSNCVITLKDSMNISANLSLPSFTINVVTPGPGPVTPPTITNGIPSCFDSELVCTNGVYQIKSGGSCQGGNLGKSCSGTGTTLFTGEIQKIIKDIKGLTESGFVQMIKDVQSSRTKSTVSIYLLSGGAQVKTYLPNYNLWIIKKIMVTVNKSLISTIKKQWEGYVDSNYFIDSYSKVVDTRAVVSKDISAITKLYNDFAITLYLILDQKQTQLLPLVKYYLKTYFAEVAAFGKKVY